MKLILAAALSLLAAPTFAADAETMTCKDLMAMDSAGMTTAATSMKNAMKGNAKMDATSEADVSKMAEDACTTNPDGTVMDAMHASMITTMTCKDMMAMDEAGMTKAGKSMKMAMKDDAAMSAMADTDVAKKAGEACAAKPDGTVMDAMKM